MVAKGYGMENPAATNDTVEGRAANRRVELKRLL
jgi:outer membrane protein OmpA-like peptidoglycan-associated protein